MGMTLAAAVHEERASDTSKGMEVFSFACVLHLCLTAFFFPWPLFALVLTCLLRVKNICGEDSEEGDDNRTDAQSYGPCRWRIAMVTYQSNSDSSIVFHRTSVIFLLHSDFPDLFAFFLFLFGCHLFYTTTLSLVR